MTDRTYYFAIVETLEVYGGLNILFDFMSVLQAGGYRVAPLYRSRYYRYPFAPFDGPAFYSPDLPGRVEPWYRYRGGIAQKRARVRNMARGFKPNALAKIRQSDVLVVPDFAYDRYAAAFPDMEIVVMVQNVVGFLRPWLRDNQGGDRILDRARLLVCISQVCVDVAQTLVPAERCAALHLPVASPELTYTPEKKMQIAYMTRRRSQEVDFVTTMLRAMPEMRDVEFVKIENMSLNEVHLVMRDALVYLSFSEREGFGLPPAEAMLAGCIVVGYTGVGGNEYFDETTGIVIEDGDVVSFARAVAAVVKEYRVDPTRLDRMRRAASRSLAQRYDRDASHRQLLDIWHKLDASLDADRIDERVAISA
ncbi:glycosyl transferase, group 1 family protein [Oceaniovalibus guishaninsula JLT2003]|uniref:Glycosyl transferase, group 1 family protein n=1 Tax=Oceaniovalibus guishaninsula JLT2003 TaxID=1231392 RepID=K2HR65_9RHOB|nr:glycosyltransferase [Oceaniovalibus guishaninsula]EKE45244.1 glycosyl transferase, group 1 family protein [Oceaniovalibus guishaninsula JLT2003]